MRIEPRRNLLEIWRAVAAWSYHEGQWYWNGRQGSNSVSDAQQLLCIMFPATEISAFNLAFPDRTDHAVLKELRHLGGAMEISLLLVQTVHEYLDKYTAKDGHETSIFHGGTHFQPSCSEQKVADAQESLDVVESYATSLTLMLAVLLFARDFYDSVSDVKVKADVERLLDRASRRLTAAMVGLLRSFSVSVFESDTDFGKALIRTANQQQLPEQQLVIELRQALRPVMDGLREVVQGSGQGKNFVGATLLFECGWSWGVIHGTEPIRFEQSQSPDAGDQPTGVAADEPYLYFTTVALDAIADLFTDRVRRANLLNEEQQRLARALQLRWDLTQQYWSILASFGARRWPLEDLPWAATDNTESDYLTALVAGIAMRDLVLKQPNESDLDRVGIVLAELCARGRITRRPMKTDSAIKELHDLGYYLELNVHPELITGPKSECLPGCLVNGPKLLWPIQDYAAVLLKRSIQVATLFTDTQLQAGMVELGDQIWGHLRQRRFADGSAESLWDQPHRVYGEFTTRIQNLPSWQMTIRVVESLVIAAGLVASDPPRSGLLEIDARDMISEAERLLDKELLGGAEEAGPAMRRAVLEAEVRLRRARDVVGQTPATAIALVLQVLTELDQLTAAREDSNWAR